MSETEPTLSESERPEDPYVLGAAALAFVVLLGIIATSPGVLVFDERPHFVGVRLRAEGASLPELLDTPLPSAPGPLYVLLHGPFHRLTGLDAPLARWVNLGLLVVGIVATAVSLRWLGWSQPWSRALMLLAVPMVWVTGGMALTEVPAFAKAALSLLAALWATSRPDRGRLAIYAGFLASGLLAGLAILGRQTYLPALGAFVVLGLADPRWRWPSVLAFLMACAPTLPVFLTWGGLVPSDLADTGGGISMRNGLLAFAYLGVVVGLLAPRFFFESWRWALSASAIGGLTNLLLFRFRWTAMAGLTEKVPPGWRDPLDLIVGTVLLAAGLGVLAAILGQVWQRRGADPRFVVLAGLALALTGTAAGITHLFSSRYLMTGFPFVLLMVQPSFQPSKWAALRLLAGAALGAFSLSSYFG